MVLLAKIAIKSTPNKQTQVFLRQDRKIGIKKPSATQSLRDGQPTSRMEHSCVGWSLFHIECFASALEGEVVHHVLERLAREEHHLLHLHGLQCLLVVQVLKRLHGLRVEHRLERACRNRPCARHVRDPCRAPDGSPARQ